VSWDLALANGDLVVSGAGDFAGISGTDLLEQRISIRCRLHRNEWIYDVSGTLGSQLFKLVGASQAEAVKAASVYVQEALRPMASDISIVKVETVVQSARSITFMVHYRVLDDPGATSEQEAEVADITIGGTV